MNPKDSSEVTVATLLALRNEPDALRRITDKLGVQEMGPADHIRTKHEVKNFLDLGSETSAKDLLRRASERRKVGLSVSRDVRIHRSQKP